MNGKKIEEIGKLLRFITPVLITIIGMLVLANLSSIDDKIVEVKAHFENHVSHHSNAASAYTDFRVAIESRLASIETFIKIKH